MKERRDLKSLNIKYSGRSSDYISPSFATGCLLECSYCYMKRNTPIGVTFYNNVNNILLAIDKHSKKLETYNRCNKPNQVDNKYIVYDISCNEDFALHIANHEWEKIFTFFKQHKQAKATLATKIIPKKLLTFNPNKKIRIRFSLMPQKLSTILEPKTPKIIDRIKAINTFIEAGYEVHINYSPVIIYKNWLNDYKELFELVNEIVLDKYKSEVLAEVIFLTHNENKHIYNVNNNIPGEQLLWVPNLQESKISQYGGNNVRYKHPNKELYINQFKELHNNIISWNKIRYIF
jgi:spore photoproduct lyase